MSEPAHITVDMDKRCDECSKGGATGSGLCMKCAGKAVGNKPMKSARGRAVQARYKEMRDAWKRIV